MPEMMQLILLIVAINITYVSLMTVRFILMIKGQRLLASSLSVFEVLVYITGLSIILSNLNSIWTIAAYCLGYGTGVFLGSIIEERLALGYISAQVIVDSLNETLAYSLRKEGFGVTSWVGQGRDGHRLVMQVLARRNRQKELMKIIDENCPSAFVMFHEPKHFRGGFWVRRV